MADLAFWDTGLGKLLGSGAPEAPPRAGEGPPCSLPACPRPDNTDREKLGACSLRVPRLSAFPLHGGDQGPGSGEETAIAGPREERTPQCEGQEQSWRTDRWGEQRKGLKRRHWRPAQVTVRKRRR